MLLQRPGSPFLGRAGFLARMGNPGPFGWSARPPTRFRFEGQARAGMAARATGVFVVWVPLNAREVRPIIFSHGELGGPDLYAPLLTHWASHGFLVVAPVHDDSITLSTLARRAEIRDAGVQSFLSGSGPAWQGRAADLSAALDALPVIARETGISILDDRPVVAGHSFGAHSASLAMGVAPTAAAGAAAEMEPRFFSSLLLSPSGRGAFGLSEGSWSRMRGPAMWVSGSGDSDTLGQIPERKVDGFHLAPPGNRHLAWFARILPTWYGGSGVRPDSPQETAFGDLRAVTTAFLHAYGLFDAAALRDLASESFDAQAGRRIATSWR